MSADVRSRMDAEDVLQQVYVRVLQSGTLEDRGAEAFFGWLKSILDSALVDAQRLVHAQKRDVRREVSPGKTPSTLDAWAREYADSQTPSRVLARDEARGLLLAALAGLPEDHRRVLELRYLKEMNAREVAALMNRSTAAVQMLAVRALRHLRESMRALTLTWG